MDKMALTKIALKRRHTRGTIKMNQYVDLLPVNL